MALELPSLDSEGPSGVDSLIRILGVMTGFGFVLGTIGHVIKSRTLVAIGIICMMLGAVAFMVAVGRYG
jgi:hypothetical protein